MAETVAVRRRRARFWILAFLWLVVALVLAAAIGGYAFLRASLPTLDGEIAAAGLRGPVTVTRDAQGVPTIRGGDRGDVAFATGFVHAQERFFQMDLLRRAGAGELAALLGKALLPVDRERRIHRFGARAGVALAALPEADRVLLERYAAGVNAGLAGLAARPFEYGVLRATPRPWVAQDTLLVVWAMYFDLQEEQLHRVFSRGWLRDQGTTAEQLAFLLPTASGYDAPLDAPAIDAAPAPLPAQAPAWFGKPAKTKVALLEDVGDAEVGSNNWVVAGGRSKSGAAIVANDMHLTLRLPHIWYRAAIELESAGAPLRRLVGVTLPGTPALVAGSNGQVAWGLTNSYGAYLDLLELELDPKDASRYRLPPTMRGASGDEWGLVRTVEERIAVAGGEDEVLPVKETAFGPVWERGGRRYAVHWVAHDPGAVNFVPFELERATTTAEAHRHRQARRLPGAEPGGGRCRRPHRLDRRRRAARARGDLGLDLSRRRRAPPRRTPGARSPRRRRIRASATRRRGRSSPPTRASSPAPATRRSATAAPTSARASASCATASPRSGRAPTRPASTASSSTTAPSTSRPGATAPCRPSPATPIRRCAPSATNSSACSRPPGPAGRASIRSATG